MTDRWLRAAAPLAALLYPALVWSGPAVWPPLLGLALVPPAIAVWTSLRLADPRDAARRGREPRAARAIALAAIGAPALFSLLGGLLDFQGAIPLTSVRVWIPLWLGLAAIAWREPRSAAAPAAADALARAAVPSAADALARAAAGPTRPGRLALAHGISALPIAAFALAHLANHVTGAAGGAVHVAVMHALREVYRHPLVEPVLIGCVVLQVITGIALVARRLARPAAALVTLQSAAGAYLALFFASHVTAVLRARGRGVDTDWHWLTGSDLLRDPWSARLVPYYVLSVLAVSVHLACAVRAVAIGHGARREAWGWPVAAAAGLAAAAAAVMVTALAA